MSTADIVERLHERAKTRREPNRYWDNDMGVVCEESASPGDLSLADELDEAAAEIAALRAKLEEAVGVLELARAVNKATFSHVDRRDLLAELHPRNTLDIRRRVDGVETRPHARRRGASRWLTPSA